MPAVREALTQLIHLCRKYCEFDSDAFPRGEDAEKEIRATLPEIVSAISNLRTYGDANRLPQLRTFWALEDWLEEVKSSTPAWEPNEKDRALLQHFLKSLGGTTAPQPGPEDPAVAAPREGNDPGAQWQDLVTLDQAASMVHTSKRTLERYKTKGTLPAPVVEGGGGRADRYLWSTIGPWLEEKFGIKQPAKYPANVNPADR
ncbi:MAG: hypothetical protein NVSMB9_22180 [Isosphaeraceae bacterium]